MRGRRTRKGPIRFGELVRPPLNRRRWFQIGVGIVVLMAAVAVLLLGWIAYNRHWIYERQAMLTEPGVHQVRSGFKYAVDTPWSLRLFGEPSIEALSIPESECDRAQKLFPESMLQVRRGE